ncbi:MAG TPA: hypothetical protein VF193_11050 [Steroidobacter sp.]
MDAQLKQKWDEAEANPGRAVDIGRIVVCDFCDADHTDTPITGGVIFGSKAVCPECVHYVAGEPEYIKARCPDGQSFGDFVRAYRGPSSAIIVAPASAPKCRSCRQPFSDANVHTSAGWAETRISGMCEDCFDAMFAEEDE